MSRLGPRLATLERRRGAGRCIIVVHYIYPDGDPRRTEPPDSRPGLMVVRIPHDGRDEPAYLTEGDAPPEVAP